MSILDVLKLNDAQIAKETDFHNPTKFANLAGAMKSYVNAWPRQELLTNYLRASQLYYVCPREFVLNYFEPKPVRNFDAKSQFMMGCGSYLHDLIQNMILGPMGVLKGRWVCQDQLKGKSPRIIEGYHPDPEKAIYEHAKQVPLTWRYQEYALYDSHYRISGHIDGVVSLDKIQWLADNYKLMRTDPHKAYKELQTISPGVEAKLEIKTCGSYIYEKITTANTVSDAYKMQSNIYQAISKIHKAVFWYVNRDTMDSKILPYWHEKHWWESAKNKARVIWEAIRDYKLPEVFRACNLPTDSRAKQCVFRDQCFQRQTSSQFSSWCHDQIAKNPLREWLDLSEKVF